MSIKSISLKAGLAAALLLAGTAASFAASAYATGEVNVRRGPGTGYGVVDQLYRGESVDVDGCRGGWCRITHSGPDGWVSASYLGRDRYNDDDFYDNDVDVDVDFFVRAPRQHRPWRNNRPWRDDRWHDDTVCIGGPNATFCISD